MNEIETTEAAKPGVDEVEISDLISAVYLDQKARPGLEYLNSAFAANATDLDIRKAELALKAVRQGTSRMSAENSRIAMGLKVAKVIGLAAEHQQPLWELVVGKAKKPQIEGQSKQKDDLPKSAGKSHK